MMGGVLAVSSAAIAHCRPLAALVAPTGPFDGLKRLGALYGPARNLCLICRRFGLVPTLSQLI